MTQTWTSCWCHFPCPAIPTKVTWRDPSGYLHHSGGCLEFKEPESLILYSMKVLLSPLQRETLYLSSKTAGCINTLKRTARNKQTLHPSLIKTCEITGAPMENLLCLEIKEEFLEALSNFNNKYAVTRQRSKTHSREQKLREQRHGYRMRKVLGLFPMIGD